MVAGGVHLCPEDPCPLAFDGTIGIHATRVRSWALQKFAADYLSRSGKAALKKAIRRCQAPFRWPACCGSSQALKGASQGAFQAKAPSRCWRAGVPSDGEELDGEADATGPDSAALRDKLRETRERIIGSTTPLGARRGCDSWVRRVFSRPAGGWDLSVSWPVHPAGIGAIGGYKRRRGEELDEDAGETIRCRLSFAGSRRAACRQINKPASGARTRRTRERTTQWRPCSTFCRARRKGKRRRREIASQIAIRMDLLGGSESSRIQTIQADQTPVVPQELRKLKQIKEAPASRLQRRGQRAEHRTSSTSQSSQRTGLGHGHVGQKHAQDQLDKGTLLETEGAYSAGITLGVEISTFFALLIRPFYTQRRMPWWGSCMP